MDDPTAEGDDFGAAYCVGYIDAAFSFSVYHEESKRRREVCWPKLELTTGQLVQVVVKYLKEHPADLHEEALLLTIRAFEEAFPCR